MSLKLNTKGVKVAVTVSKKNALTAGDFSIPEGYEVVDVTGMKIEKIPWHEGDNLQSFHTKDGEKIMEIVYSSLVPAALKYKCFLVDWNFTFKVVKQGSHTILVPLKKIGVW